MARTTEEIQADLDKAQEKLSKAQDAIDGLTGELQLVTSGVERGDTFSKGRKRFEVRGYNAGEAKVVGMLYTEAFEILVSDLLDVTKWDKV